MRALGHLAFGNVNRGQRAPGTPLGGAHPPLAVVNADGPRPPLELDLAPLALRTALRVECAERAPVHARPHRHGAPVRETHGRHCGAEAVRGVQQRREQEDAERWHGVPWMLGTVTRLVPGP